MLFRNFCAWKFTPVQHPWSCSCICKIKEWNLAVQGLIVVLFLEGHRLLQGKTLLTWTHKSRKDFSKGIPQSLTPAYFQNYPTDHGPGTRPKLSNSLSLFRRYFLPIPCLYFYLFLIYPCLNPACYQPGSLVETSKSSLVVLSSGRVVVHDVLNVLPLHQLDCCVNVFHSSFFSHWQCAEGKFKSSLFVCNVAIISLA